MDLSQETRRSSRRPLLTNQRNTTASAFSPSLPAQWTLEYCLWKSTTFGTKFAEIAKAVHSRTDWTNFEATLSDKLQRRTLAKTEISARLAQAIAKGEIDGTKLHGDQPVAYLIQAIRYACGLQPNP